MVPKAVIMIQPKRKNTMQVFGNLATPVEIKESKQGKRYAQFRLAEATRGVDTDPTFYTVRVMKDQEFNFTKGDFLKVTGKLKADFYLSREGKPTGTLLIIAFEASKIAKPSATAAEGQAKGNASSGQLAQSSVSTGPATVPPAAPAAQSTEPAFEGWSD